MEIEDLMVSFKYIPQYRRFYMEIIDCKSLMIGDWVMVAECVADAHFRDYPDKKLIIPIFIQ